MSIITPNTPATNVTPEVEYYVKRFMSSGEYKIIVPNCPYCHKKHIHNKPLNTITRLKIAHCSIGNNLKHYRLSVKLSKVKGIVD